MIAVDLHRVLGLGVVGNFAGHLAQAGEDKFFAPATQEAPKGLFPFYVPGAATFLGAYPFSATRIARPAVAGDLQAEPELALLCEVAYDGARVAALRPVAFAAHNDCSIRNNAPKISIKKNWGPDSKGTSDTFLPIDRFEPGGVLDRYRIACYLERGGTLHAYGVDSAAASYTYFYRQLTDWAVERIAAQADSGPLESLAPLFLGPNRPSQVLLSAGATRYTPFGESGFLVAGDVVYVVVYDGTAYDAPAVERRIGEGNLRGAGLSVLRQTVG